MKKIPFKLIVFILTLLILFSLFLYLIIKPYSYKINYKIDKYSIEEIYEKENGVYTFLITKDNITYPYQFEHKYINKKELITKIEKYNSEEETCILPGSNKLEFSPLCSNNKEIYSYNNAKTSVKDFEYDKIDDLNEKYERLTIHNRNNKNYLVYNYKGYYYLSNDKKENIELFKQDKYNIDLVYQHENLILVPDYNQDHYFSKLNLIDIKTGKLKEIEFDYEISFNSRFLGAHKNKIYLLDIKEKKEYMINLKKEKVYLVDFVILDDKKLIKTTFNNINNNNLTFGNNYSLDFEIIDNKLYQKINNEKVLISKHNIQKIVKVDNNSVYYIDNENLYVYDSLKGEVKILTDFELNFNNTNMIFISE